MYVLLADILKSCAVHGQVSRTLLISTLILIPLVKYKLGDINSSKNYRSVAVSSVLVKLIDWVIILLEEDVIKLNELQFAYQRGCSTVIGTGAAVETIDYYLKKMAQKFSLVQQTCPRPLI